MYSHLETRIYAHCNIVCLAKKHCEARQEMIAPVCLRILAPLWQKLVATP